MWVDPDVRVFTTLLNFLRKDVRVCVLQQRHVFAYGLHLVQLCLGLSVQSIEEMRALCVCRLEVAWSTEHLVGVESGTALQCHHGLCDAVLCFYDVET